MPDPLNYEHHDPNTPARPWSIAAIIGLPLGVLGPVVVIGLAIDGGGFLVLPLIPLTIIAAFVCSWIGFAETGRTASPKRGRAVALAGLMINSILVFMIIYVLLVVVK